MLFLTCPYASLFVIQALSIISDIGDMLLAKYSRQPVPEYSENDEDFRQRHAKDLYCVNEILFKTITILV